MKPSVMADSVELLNSSEPVKAMPKAEEKPKTLYLKFNTKDENLKNEVIDILKSYSGSSDVVIKCSLTNQIYKLNIKVNLNSFVNQELKSVIGENNIVVR